MADISVRDMLDFRQTVWRYYRAHGRHDLPWRKTFNLYHLLVSEVMLQQTQVKRVIPFYTKFISRFGTAEKLSKAPLSEVLKYWQGLGYNRRARTLHSAANELSIRKSFTVKELEMLPGVGPYTARAIAAFAFNEDVIFIETNIRTAVIHHFFSNRNKITDVEIERVLIAALPRGKAREWYNALMDYGTFLKRSGISHNAQSTQYVRQSKFAGSIREARGAILRELSKGMLSEKHLVTLLGRRRRKQSFDALNALIADGLVQKENDLFALPS